MIPPPITSSRSGTSGKLERAGGVDDPRVVGHVRERDGLRADRDDRVLEGDLGAVDVERVRAGELGGALDDLDVAGLGHAGQAVGELLDGAVLERAHAVEVDLGLAEGDPRAGGLLGVGEHAREVQQRLGGDAADVEADAAEALVALDEHGLQAEVGGAEGGGVAARARADHDHVGAVAVAAVVGRLLRLGLRGLLLLRRRLLLLRGLPVGLEREDRRALRDLVADLDEQLADGAGLRRGHVHARLVGLEHDQRVLGGDGVAGRDQHLDDGDVGEVPDVRDLDLAHSRARRMSARTPARCVVKRAASAPSTTRWS